MHSLALKLMLTPTLIAAVSLAGRRWGPGVSGWLVGLPLTSGPVALFLALDQGSAFAADAARGILAGSISIAAFCLVYGRLSVRWGWQGTVTVSWLVFLASTWALQRVTLALPMLFLAIIVVLAFVLIVLPDTPGSRVSVPSPWWDIPARVVLATAFVLALTGLAPVLGPQLSGLLAPFPIFASILAVFTHRLYGSGAAARLIRGIVLGLFAFVGFFLVLAVLIQRAGIGAAFLIATVVALVVQGASLWLLQRRALAR